MPPKPKAISSPSFFAIHNRDRHAEDFEKCLVGESAPLVMNNTTQVGRSRRQLTQRPRAASKFVSLDTEALEHLHEEIGERRVVLRVEGKTLAVFETAGTCGTTLKVRGESMTTRVLSVCKARRMISTSRRSGQKNGRRFFHQRPACRCATSHSMALSSPSTCTRRVNWRSSDSVRVGRICV